MSPEQLTALQALRKPFPPHQISKLPKPTKAQTEAVKADYRKGVRCQLCGTWHHQDVVHLDYVGHAALTDRLLDVDPAWSWEPLHLADGLPLFDNMGGMWIKLTVCGVTRLGYGAAEGKSGPDAIKEVIGDALRNAAMRFGAALELWHKGELHVDDPAPATAPKAAPTPAQIAARVNAAVADGKASEVASYLQGMPVSQLDPIVSLLEPATFDALRPYLEAAQ